MWYSYPQSLHVSTCSYVEWIILQKVHMFKCHHLHDVDMSCVSMSALEICSSVTIS